MIKHPVKPSMVTAIVRELRQRFTMLLWVPIALFAILLACMMHIQTQRQHNTIGQIAWNILDVHDRDHPHLSLEHACEVSTEVIAAAYLNRDGTLRAIWPRDIQFENETTDVYANNTTMSITKDDISYTTRLMVQPATTASGDIVLWIDHPSWWPSWLMAVSAYSIILYAIKRLLLRSFIQWLQRRIANPMKHIITTAAQEHIATEQTLTTNAPWSELDAINQELESLNRERTKLQRQITYMERRGEDKLIANSKHYERRLKHTTAQTLTDALTRMLNRRFLRNELENIYNTSRESNVDLAIVMIDLDNFKNHNDTLGHQAGDEMLKFSADLIRGAIRKGDYPIRYGGDEFVILMPATDRKQAHAVVQRFVTLFAQYSRRENDISPVSMSAGIATRLTEHTSNGHELMDRADAALYRAKNSGKNTVVLSRGAA